MKPLFVLSLFLFFSSTVAVFYVPGVQPKTYKDGDEVILQVERLSSAVTQLPYSYYFLDFCAPETIKSEPENLGEILRGDRIESSPFVIKAKQDVKCAVLCVKNYTADDLKLFHNKITEQYKSHWIIDNLPAMTTDQVPTKDIPLPKYTGEGFPVGIYGAAEFSDSKKEQNYLNNHVDIYLLYHESTADNGGLKIVGFIVSPDSVKHLPTPKGKEYPDSCFSRDTYDYQSVTSTKPLIVTFTYTVTWLSTPLEWHHRWEPIFAVQSGKVHWFSILNSIVIVLFLSSMVAVIMTNILKSDFKRYSEMSTIAATTASLLTEDVESGDKKLSEAEKEERKREEKEETGWKLIYADVFRPPYFSMLFSVLVGFGTQVFSCALITMAFSVLGFLSPANRGSLLTAMIISFAVTGIIAGYASGRLYKFFQGQFWKRNAYMTALFVQGVVFLIVLILDLILAAYKSSGQIPMKVLFVLLAIWIGVSLPLVFVGSYMAFRAPALEVPTKTNVIPREIPVQPWYSHPLVCILLGGILPFSAIFIELYFILSSIWLDQIYYLFGFLALVFIVLGIACSEVSIVLCYIQLCGEDWRWWWRSFLSVGAAALYLFFYSIFYFFTRLQITQSYSTALYFGYTTIITIFFFTFSGSIGFWASFWFVKKIYGSIKVD